MPDNDQRDVRKLDLASTQAALFETGRREHRVLLVYLVTTVLVIFLSTGVITLDHRIVFTGLVITLPTSLLLLGGACLVAVLQFYDVGLVAYARSLRQHILRGYQVLGFEPDSETLDVTWSPFVYPDAFTVVFRALEKAVIEPYVISPVTDALPRLAKKQQRAGGLLARLGVAVVVLGLIYLGLFALPLIAEGLAIRDVLLHQSFNGLIALAVALILVIDVAAWFVSRRSSAESHALMFRAFVMKVAAVLQSLAADGQTLQSSEDATPAADGNQPGKQPRLVRLSLWMLQKQAERARRHLPDLRPPAPPSPDLSASQ